MNPEKSTKFNYMPLQAMVCFTLQFWRQKLMAMIFYDLQRKYTQSAGAKVFFEVKGLCRVPESFSTISVSVKFLYCTILVLRFEDFF